MSPAPLIVMCMTALKVMVTVESGMHGSPTDGNVWAAVWMFTVHVAVCPGVGGVQGESAWTGTANTKSIATVATRANGFLMIPSPGFSTSVIGLADGNSQSRKCQAR